MPAEPIDHISRPQYITRNDANMEVCTNRLSCTPLVLDVPETELTPTRADLVEKGAILKKGHRLRSRFCKFTRGENDSFFNAVLFVSASDVIYRCVPPALLSRSAADLV